MGREIQHAEDAKATFMRKSLDPAKDYVSGETDDEFLSDTLLENSI